MSRLEVFVQTNIHPDDAATFREVLSNCLTTGESFSCRYRLRRADGVYRWMSGRAEPMRDEGGHITQWYGLAHDVDDQVRAEEALRQSEQQLRQMIYAVPVRIWSTPAAGGPIAFNKRFRDHLRSVIPDFDDLADPSIERVMQELIHSEDAPEVRRTLQTCFEAGAAAAMRFRWRERDGIYRWVECRVEPRRNQDGGIEEWYGISLDIDDEMRAQEALRARERELELLVDMVPVNIGRVSPDGLPTFFNKRLIDFLGADIADLDKPGISRLAAAIATAIHPDDAPGFTEAFGRSLATGEPLFIKYRLHRADGVYRWVENRFEPLRDQDGAIVQWYGVSLDIDDEVRAQQALQRSERQLQQLIDTVPAVIWCATPEGIPCYMNKRATDVTGLTLTDLLAPDGSRSLTVVHPDDRETYDQALARSFKTGTSFEGRYRQRRADGAHRWVESRAEPLRDDSGNIVQWYGATVDVHEMVTTQEALRDRERELSQLVNMVPIFLWRLTPDGTTATFFNKRLFDFFGQEPAHFDAPGRTQAEVAIDEVVHPDDKVSFGEEFNRCIAAGERFAMRYRVRRFDGVYRWVDGRIEPMRGQDGRILQWYGLAYDIDDHVHAEEALRRASDKLARATQAASLAELSASIAHEVNQPLAAIVANSHACQRWLESDPPNLERAQIIVNRIIRDARSAAEVVSRIRSLFKQAVEPRHPTALASIIAEARNLVTEEATRRRVRIEEEIESDLPLVAFDRVQIQQVLINLIGNGMDAMDFSAGSKVLKVRVRRMGDTVQTEICDRGKGIAFPDKIFEPFFTTKENGMGMGLAICRSIVESHGGQLWAEDNRPHGATFIFTLPVEEKAAS
jgi:PAS domain S-box-containing protein